LKEVYLISVDKTKNPRFFLRDFLEYIKKVLTLQLNVVRIKMDERVQIREEGLCHGIVETVLLQRIEGISRGMFCLHSSKRIIKDDPVGMEADLLRLLLAM
jgi:hypothetical protein